MEREASDIRSSSSSGGAGEPSSSSAASSSVAVAAGDESNAREDARNYGKEKAGSIGAHTCDKCGRTFATGQSLGGHMRKHYDGPLKKRTREQQDKTPAPTVERRVRTASSAAPSESHNNNGGGGDCERNGEEPERPPSAGDAACRLHNFFPNNELTVPEEGPKKALQPEPERKVDDDGDDDDDDDDEELLSLRLGRR